MTVNAGKSPLVLRVVNIEGDEDRAVRAFAEYLVAAWQERQVARPQVVQVASPVAPAASSDDVAA